ncbi:hypothetical protein AWC38_SpisGene7110 [Stylophora pistillata]|uniref:BRICHOS domain-containing protein n=1 Tax=Stylophora pistillata TaxID=50429 RepID=A0A2B4SGL5_STYPI|nr:hypothetical protein AWC38_SpisGene7110 [Stylophora pistillata]
MGFSPLCSVSVILLVYVIQIQALLLFLQVFRFFSQLPRNEVHVRRETQKFKLTITEKGTRFDEKVEINEDEQIAYFNVPPHNGLPENEELFDYRMNVTVRRSKSDGACYLKPLPEDLPRPKDLDTGLTQFWMNLSHDFAVSGRPKCPLPRTYYPVIFGFTCVTLTIFEKGTRFEERVEINEDEQIAYFNVPPHYGLPENEEPVFDYRMNVSVRRSKTDKTCYLKPLPEDLPRPKDLDTGFTQALNRPINYKISKISKEWIITGKVDKMFLRKEIKEFCDQYPNYRLKEYEPDSVSVARGGPSVLCVIFGSKDQQRENRYHGKGSFLKIDTE